MRSEDIINSFEADIQGQGQTDNSNKELFNAENVEVKTDLELNEIRSIIKTKLLMKMLNGEEVDLDRLMTDYMTLKISHKRQSRKEFASTFGKENEKEREIANFNFTR